MCELVGLCVLFMSEDWICAASVMGKSIRAFFFVLRLAGALYLFTF